MATSAGASSSFDRTLVLGLAGATLLLIVLMALFGPARYDDNQVPSTYNAGTQGVKAAYLLAGDLGYHAVRSTAPLWKLNQVDAPNTTLVLTDPAAPVKSLKVTQDAIDSFLRRGGTVVVTGAGGAKLLPGGKTAPANRIYKELCYSRPEGPGELARAGSIEIGGAVRWDANGPEFRVEQRCLSDAVVVSYPYGKGEAIWWASAMPMSNASLRDDGNLALTLASLGPARNGSVQRTILFDEYLHEHSESAVDLLSGLPWLPFWTQMAALAALLIFSFSRRRGPIRMPLRVPRTSPLEFAESMGRLYQTANATQAPLDAARAETLRFLAEVCGLSQETLRQPPSVVAEALSARIGGDWTDLAAHLNAASNASDAAPTGKLALKLVQALEHDRKQLEAQVSASRQTVS
jgi:hypothetical protein